MLSIMQLRMQCVPTLLADVDELKEIGVARFVEKVFPAEEVAPGELEVALVKCGQLYSFN